MESGYLTGAAIYQIAFCYTILRNILITVFQYQQLNTIAFEIGKFMAWTRLLVKQIAHKNKNII